MYSRELSNVPEKQVVHGKAVFGTYGGHPNKIDIRGVKRPYGIIWLPTFITNLRIKSRLSYYFSVGEYTGSVDFFDAKVAGFAEIVFWNTKTLKRYIYRTVLGPRRRLVPHKLESAKTACTSKRRHIRISWNRAADRLSVIFDQHGRGARASSTAAFLGKYSSPEFAEVTNIIPHPTFRRCQASYFASLPVHGSLTIFPKKSSMMPMEDADGISFFEINRTYMKFRSHGEYLTGVGFVKGNPVTFRIEKPQENAVMPDKYTNNTLFYKGQATPLPPVVITHPFGVNNKWVIQDTEGMVDLTFTPLSDNLNKISIFVLRTSYNTMYGTFEGTLLTKDGEKVSFKSLGGIAKKYSIRL